MRKVKRIIAMLLAMLLCIPQTVSAAGTEDSHTITCMYADLEGNVDEEPYFQLEVPAGKTMQEIMEEEDYWLQSPSAVGYDASFCTGTYDEATGKVSFTDDEQVLDREKVIEADETYYIKWNKIDVGELNYEMKINNSEHVALNGENDIIQLSNEVLYDIENHLYSEGDVEVNGFASKDFITEALTADKVEFVFDIKEHYDAETDTLNGMNFSFEMSLYKDGNAEPVKTEAIDKFNYAVGVIVSLDNPNPNGAYYMASLDENGELRKIEHEGGYLSWEETSWVDEEGMLYYCVVEYMGEYEFSFQEDGGWDDGPQVPENMIELEVSYYDVDGDWIFEPIAIELSDETAGKSYADLIYEKLERLTHFDGLKNLEWSIGGEIEDLTLPAEGGHFFSVHADYENTIVQVCIEYYDAEEEYTYEYNKKICDKSETLGDIKAFYNDYLGEIKHSESMEFQNSWATYMQWEEGPADLTLTAGEIDRYEEFVISAEYGFYNVALTYAYLDDNNTVVVKDSEEKVAAGTTVKELCDEKAGAEHEWSIHPWYPIGDGKIELQTGIVVAAVQYDDKTPVFAERYYVDGEPGAYTPEEVSEIYYVNGHPEIHETEDGFIVDDVFTEAVYDAITKVREDVEGFDLAGYQLSYDPDYYQAEGYAAGLFYSIQELYDKGLVVLKWCDDEGEYVETIPVQLEDAGMDVPVGEFVLPQKGNMIQFWDIGGPTYGGDYEFSGNTVQVFAPYIYATSRYRMGIDGLTEVPAGFGTLKDVKNKLETEAVSGEDKLEASKVKCDFYDVHLMWYEGDIVEYEYFPQEGVEFYLPCPEGVELKEENFRVTHLITDEGHPNKGETEKLEIIGIDVIDGVNYLRVKAYSLSPVAVVYEAEDLVDSVVKDVLVEQIETAEAYEDKETDYTPESFTELTEALDAAKAVLADEEATQEQVDKAVAELKAAIEGLTEKAPEPPKPVKNPFVDIKAGEYYYDAVLWAVGEEITKGMTPTTFAPEGNCTRGQVVTFLWRAHGCPSAENPKNPFKDVKSEEYYYDAVLWAVEKGITNGTSATTFAPNATVTRGEFVTFLWRAEKEPEASVKNPFVDVPAGQYYTDAVLWAYEKEITTGTSKTTFEPSQTCIRRDVVTFLWRAYE